VVRALVVCFCEVYQLTVELFDPPGLFSSFKGVHGWAIKLPKDSNKVRWVPAGRYKVVCVLVHGYVFLGHSGLAKALDDVTVHAPQHWADEAFWGWRRKR